MESAVYMTESQTSSVITVTKNNGNNTDHGIDIDRDSRIKDYRLDYKYQTHNESIIYKVPRLIKEYPFVMIFIILAVFIVAVTIAVHRIDAIDRYSQSKEFHKALDSDFYLDLCYAVIFSTIPIFINWSIDVVKMIYLVLYCDEIVNADFLKRKLVVFCMFLSLPLQAFLGALRYHHLVSFQILNSIGIVAAVAALLIAIVGNTGATYWTYRLALPMFTLICLGMLLWVITIRAHPPENVAVIFLFSNIAYYSGGISLTMLILHSWYHIGKKYLLNRELVTSHDAIVLSYTMTMVTAYVVYAVCTNITGSSNNPLKADDTYFAINMYTKLAVFLGFKTISSRFALDRLDFAEYYANVVMNKQEELDVINSTLKREKEKNYELLSQMLPNYCIDALQSGKVVRPELFAQTTVFFSDIEGFNNLLNKVEPLMVVNLLNKVYTVMDHLSSLFPTVYKVETIADSYVCASGVPEKNADHAYDIADFAIMCSRLIQCITNPVTKEPIRIRIGLHSGPVMAGIIGLKMPRYCLFGDTVNTTSRMESNGLAGRIHLSEDMAKLLMASGMYEIEERGSIRIKNKGIMKTFFLLGPSKTNKNATEARILTVFEELIDLLKEKIDVNSTSIYQYTASLTSSKSELSVSGRTAMKSLKSQSSISGRMMREIVGNQSSPTQSKKSTYTDDETSVSRKGYQFPVAHDNQSNGLVNSNVQKHVRYILLIDPNATSRKRHKRMLKTCFPTFEVLEADTGVGVFILIDKVGHSNVAAILVDRYLQGTTSTELVLGLTNSEYSGCIIGITSDPSTTDAFKNDCNGSLTAVLVKPIQVDVLKSIIIMNMR